MRARIFLLKELVKRDFQSRYAGSLLGVFWSLLQPLWQLALFSFVFATVMKIPLTGERTDNFAIFLFAGLIPWMAIQEGISRAATAITDNANLVKNIQFPPALLPLVAVLGGLLQSALAGMVFLPILVYSGHLKPGGLPLLLLVIPLQFVLTLGLGLIACCLHTLFRDTAQALGMVLMGWFYLTPIVYPMSLLPGPLVPFLQLNPLTSIVHIYRQAFLAGEMVPGFGVGHLAAVASLCLGLGYLLFSRLGDSLVDDV